IPEDARNTTIHESFVKPASAELPSSALVAKEWWGGQRSEWMKALQEKVFHGWPDQAPPLTIRPAAEVKHGGMRLGAFDFTSEAGTSAEAHIRRRFVLLGQTLDGQRVWDIRRGLSVLRTLPELKTLPLWLQGHGEMAGIVLYAGLFELAVARIDLWHPPASHRQ